MLYCVFELSVNVYMCFKLLKISINYFKLKIVNKKLNYNFVFTFGTYYQLYLE